MALAAGLAREGTPPQRLETEASTSFEQAGEGFKLSSIRLTIRGRVEGIDDAAFRAAAESAKENCPVSQALKGNVEISLDASLSG
jgi:lipoyl-dependent peroxiredoxin